MAVVCLVGVMGAALIGVAHLNRTTATTVTLTQPVTSPVPTASSCPTYGALSRHDQPRRLPGGVVSVRLCRSLYAHEAGSRDYTADALVENPAGVVTSLRRIPPPAPSEASCTLVGGFRPTWLVFTFADGSYRTLGQGQCSFFDFEGKPHAGFLVQSYAAALKQQRLDIGEPATVPAQPACTNLGAEDPQGPQSVMAGITDSVAATVCVTHRSTGSTPQTTGPTVTTVPVPTRDLEALLVDIAAHRRPPGGRLDTKCADHDDVITLIGVDRWGDLSSLTANYCRSFTNDSIWWFADSTADTILDRLIGSVGR